MVLPYVDMLPPSERAIVYICNTISYTEKVRYLDHKDDYLDITRALAETTVGQRTAWQTRKEGTETGETGLVQLEQAIIGPRVLQNLMK